MYTNTHTHSYTWVIYNNLIKANVSLYTSVVWCCYPFAERKCSVILDTLFHFNSKNFATGSLCSLITGYNQRTNNPSIINHKLDGHQAGQSFSMAFWNCTWLFDFKEFAGRKLLTHNWYPTMYKCGLFTASTLLNNYCTFLRNRNVTRPFLSAKGRQCHTNTSGGLNLRDRLRQSARATHNMKYADVLHVYSSTYRVTCIGVLE